jgi:SET domain-containing protein
MPRTPKYAPADLDLLVKRSNTGLGLFAGEDIPKGACIIEYTGKILNDAQAATASSRYLFEVSRGKTIDGSPRSNKARYINHSCRPNAEPDIYKGRVFIMARKKIKAGEQITYDYGDEYLDMFIRPHGCKCGAH